MAVLTGITGAVRANIAGAAQQAVKSVATGVKSIAGLNPEGSNSALSSTTNLMGGTSSSILSYPLAVDTDPQQGHYIIFYINTRTNGKLITPKSGKSTDAALDKMQSEFGTPPPPIGPLNAGGIAGPKIAKVGSTKGRDKSIVLSKLPTKRLEKSIALYMPPTVQVSYQVKYADKEIGSLAMAGSAAIDAFMKDKGNTESKLRAAADAAGPAGKEFLTTFANKTLDTVAPGAEALSQLERGSVITPRM